MVAEKLDGQRFTLPRTISLTVWGNYLCAGVAAGAVSGVVARVAMRVVALIAGTEPAFTAAASLGIVVIFAVVGLIASVLWMGMERVLRLRATTGAALLAVGLTLLLVGPIYQAAAGDLAGVDNGTLLKFLLLFIPVPLTIGWGTVWGTTRLQKRSAHTCERTMPLASAVATLALFVAAFLTVAPLIGAPQRHPAVLGELLRSNSADFARAGELSRTVTLLVLTAYLVLTLIALWRQPDSANVRHCVLLALALPTLLLGSGSKLPTPLAWLPNAPWVLGIVQAAGLAALLWLFLIADAYTPSRPLLWAVVATWAISALWLMARPESRWTEWAIWSMLAATLILIVVARLCSTDGSTKTSLLLALFAVCWLALWAAIQMNTGLQLRLLSGFAVTLVVGLFWLPWPLLPAALIVRRSY